MGTGRQGPGHCDNPDGPCACGAWHNPEEWNERGLGEIGTMKPKLLSPEELAEIERDAQPEECHDDQSFCERWGSQEIRKLISHARALEGQLDVCAVVIESGHDKESQLRKQRDELAEQYLWMLTHAKGFRYDNFEVGGKRSLEFLDKARQYLAENDENTAI